MGAAARSTRRVLAVALPLVVVSSGAVALAAPARVDPSTGPACPRPLLQRSMPMAAALDRSPAATDRALARANDTSPRSLRAQSRAADTQLWADRCGYAFYVDDATPVAQQVDRTRVAPAEDTDAPLALEPLAQTFELSSRPGARRTVYLDFDGARVEGTAWNSSQSIDRIDATPYSIDTTATADFSDAELQEIQRAWQVVAEDFSPFDVNVTTRQPSRDALARDDLSDDRYGSRVVITEAGSLHDAMCPHGCGGLGYIDVFDRVGDRYDDLQPAWVFTAGTGTSGKSIGEAASHEVGHNFGLNHDGDGSAPYHVGVDPWAPVMGAGYYQPVSQWSAGEYAGATQTQDDTALIAAGAPVVADDHGDTAATATPLTGTAQGVVATRTDVDTFRVTASGRTTISVDPSTFANLDVELTVRDGSGSLLGRSDPGVSKTSFSAADGLGASWSGDVAAGTTLLATVDGVGHGDPGQLGGYSDYGSLGRYAVTVTTDQESTQEPTPQPDQEPTPDPTPDPEPEPETQPLSMSTTTLPRAETGSAYRARAVRVSGGTEPYSFQANGLPAGVKVTPYGFFRGVPQAAGSFRVSVVVTDDTRAGAVTFTTLEVDAAEVTEPLAFRETGWLPRARQRTRYRAVIEVTGGEQVVRWRTRRLPRGLRLRADEAGTRAVVKGRPRRKGIQRFRVIVVDESGDRIAAGFRVRVLRKRR